MELLRRDFLTSLTSWIS